MSKKKQRITQANAINQITWNYYYNQLKLIALNIIKWKNVPPSIDVRFLELMLIERGCIVFFKDSVDELLPKEKQIGLVALPLNLSGEYNIYGIPKNYYAYSPFTNYTNYHLNKNNSVLCFNNFLRQPSENIIQIFTNKMYNIDRSIDVNVNAQRTPIMVSGTANQQLTLKNIVADYDGNEPFQFIDSAIDINSFKVWNTNAPYVSDQLETLLHDKLNDFLTNFGIENANGDKKERMVTGEVNANYGNVEINRNILLQPRKIACKQINAMFGTNIDVEINTDLPTLINSPIGGENNE